jgi:hypothetical protein
MAKKSDVGMQAIVLTNLDFFGIAKTLILKSVKTDDTNIISYTDYVFNFYPLDELPGSPKSGQIVYEVVPPVEYRAMKPYYSNSTVICSLQDNMLVDKKDKVSCYVSDQGSLIITSSFATVPAMTDLSIRVKVMNPYKEFTCQANSLNVFQILLKNPSANTVLA